MVSGMAKEMSSCVPTYNLSGDVGGATAGEPVLCHKALAYVEQYDCKFEDADEDANPSRSKADPEEMQTDQPSARQYGVVLLVPNGVVERIRKESYVGNCNTCQSSEPCRYVRYAYRVDGCLTWCKEEVQETCAGDINARDTCGANRQFTQALIPNSSEPLPIMNVEDVVEGGDREAAASGGLRIPQADWQHDEIGTQRVSCK